MSIFQMNEVLAVMPEAPVTVTVGGVSFDMPAQVPFTSVHDIDVPGGTKLAVMENTTSPSGKILQVFSIDRIEIVA